MEFLAPLALLACPVGMGLMMWFMSRGMTDRKRGPEPGSIDDLRTEQARLSAQIERLEGTGTAPTPERLAESR